MLSSWRQLSKWFLPSNPVAKCGMVSKTSITNSFPIATLQRSLSSLSSSSSQAHPLINGCSTANKISTTRLLSRDSKSVNVMSSRHYMREYYKPSAWKRYNKHNIEKRLTTDSGLEILWRRVLKGRHNFAVYQRVLPNTHDCKILPKHQLRFRKHPLTKHRLPKPGLF